MTRRRLVGVLATLLALACTSPSPDPSIRSTGSPTLASPARSTLPSPFPVLSPGPSQVGTTDIVLRMQHTGGFLYPGAAIDAAPAFTLFGDGTVIYRPSTVPLIGPGGPGGGLLVAQMDGQQVDALIEYALGPGGLTEAGERYSDVPIADSVTTNFTIDTGDLNKSVAVYALGDETAPGPETAHRERFKVLANLLGMFEKEVARGNAADAGAFQPQAYRVTILADEFGDLAPTGAWPWVDLTPDDFERNPSGFGIRVLTPEEAAPLFDIPAADVGDPVVVGPDKVVYLIRYKPLLPDEPP